jgi:hypothetical protein
MFANIHKKQRVLHPSILFAIAEIVRFETHNAMANKLTAKLALIYVINEFILVCPQITLNLDCLSVLILGRWAILLSRRTEACHVQGLKVSNGLHQTFLQRNNGSPLVQLLASQGNVRLALLGIILGNRVMDNFGGGSSHLNHEVGQLVDGKLNGITEIDRTNERRVVHHADHALDQIINVSVRIK